MIKTEALDQYEVGHCCPSGSSPKAQVHFYRLEKILSSSSLFEGRVLQHTYGGRQKKLVKLRDLSEKFTGLRLSETGIWRLESGDSGLQAGVVKLV